MLYRRFGRTELQMPVFSTGGMRYQHAWKDVPLEEVPKENQANLEATIRRSVSVGINHIETARGYGSSERQLGLILPRLPREELIVQTKVAPTEDPAEFRSQVLESLERLQLEHVDLLALHGINDGETLEWSVKPGGCLEVARELQADGLVRHVGFSTHGSCDLISEAVCTERAGGFDYVNLHWYFIYQHNWPAVVEATKRDMGVFIISPSDKGGKLYAAPDKLAELTKPLHPIVFNNLFCLSRPEVHTLSIGAARPSDYDLHLESLAMYDRREEVVAPVEKRLLDELRKVFGEDFANHWDEGLPQWESVPGGVNLQIIIWLLLLARTYDMVEYGQMRYNLLGNAGHWFAGTNALEFDEAAILKALDGYRFRDRVPGLLREAHKLLYKEPVKRLSESES